MMVNANHAKTVITAYVEDSSSSDESPSDLPKNQCDFSKEYQKAQFDISMVSRKPKYQFLNMINSMTY